MSEEFESNIPPQEEIVPEDAAPDGEERKPGRELFEWLQMIMGCVLVAVVLFNCFARLTRVDGDSMNNTLENGELMLVWSLGYTPKQGDIVVLNKTTADFLGNRAIVKRVIATGGQTVDIDYNTGTVYVDGEPLDEPYIREEMYLPYVSTMQQTHWEVPEGSIFVMGDNRNASTDSRDDRLGTIDEDYVLGKVVLGLWPLSRVGAM
ncbi:signal peptidase I [Pseudoflavonifractor sp. AF19-9AC]|uniref:signal peptidase I n=1 Tax=Pseudoflavonifractor sp. AF19-9AC TaxID=2292244 RepID=UPI001FAA3B24|nr:signal peptidase I [Pseudoflavonifractor sp. AF19-9AC]